MGGAAVPPRAADFEPTFPTQFLLVHRNGLPLRKSPIKTKTLLSPVFVDFRLHISCLTRLMVWWQMFARVADSASGQPNCPYEEFSVNSIP